ncbi:MAG TPA: glycosyltransferase family 4 protein [Methylomirabilota bacterium]|jgi:glycosyltransferase involved in cell wall biosynthesis|nr:glycosyltransferase family 4 protein [Methylomirabilota bacterium]
MTKKTLLVVAPSLPDFDRHAGSRRLYSWLRILAAEYNVSFYTLQRRIDKDSRRYADALRELGVEIHAAQHTTTLAQLAGRIDHGVLFEFFHTAERLLPYLRLLRPDLPMVVSCADVHHVRESRAVAYADHPIMARARAWRTRRREVGVYGRADLVLALTEDDRRALQQAVPGAVTAVLPCTYPVARDVPGFVQRSPRSVLFVGGFRHSPNVDAMLFFCRQILPLVRRSLPDVTVTIVGDAPPKEVIALSSAQVRVTGWVPRVEPYLASHCLSIAPLRFGAGLKGKIVEAMGAGLPVVTTSVGAEGMELVHGGTALIADSAETFADSIVRLCTDQDLHARLSRSSLEHARARWDPSVVTARLLEIMARAPTLRRKSLGAMDGLLVRGRMRYEFSGIPTRVERLSSLLRWYCARLRTISSAPDWVRRSHARPEAGQPLFAYGRVRALEDEGASER